MSVICGKSTPAGPCQRHVSVPGGPCGVTHTDLVSPTGAPPSGTPAQVRAEGPPLDPFRVEPDGFRWAKTEDLWSAANDPASSPEILGELVRTGGTVIRSGVAKNPAASPEILTMLAADGSSYVRTLVAMHPATPTDVLARLAEDDHPDPRRHATQRIGT